MLDLVQFCSPRPPRGPRKRTRKGVVKDLGTDLCGLLKKKVSFEGHKRERKEPELEPDLELVGPEPIIPDLDDEKEDDFDEPVALKKPRWCVYEAWLTSVENHLRKTLNQYKIKKEMQPAGVGCCPSNESGSTEGKYVIPQTEQELNKFLRGVWGLRKDRTIPEVTKLKVFFVRKLKELTNYYAEHTEETASCTCAYDEQEDGCVNDYNTLKEHVKNFEHLQFQLKELTADAIIRMYPKSLTIVAFRDMRKLPDRALSYLEKWFLYNIKDPYPCAKDKEKIAKKCGITMRQVSNWFSSQRQKHARTCTGPRKKGGGASGKVKRRPRRRKGTTKRIRRTIRRTTRKRRCCIF